MVEKTYKVVAERGISARLAVKLAETAAQYKSDINLVHNQTSINIKSIVYLMSLGFPKDSEIRIVTLGPDENEAIVGITKMIEDQRFGTLSIKER